MNAEREDKGTDSFSNEEMETTQMDAVEGEDAEIKHDSQETRVEGELEEPEREPWCVLDMTRSFTGALNGAGLAVAALLIFVILVIATLFRYIAVVLDRSFTDYVFNGLALLTCVLGTSIAAGTLSRLHASVLKGGKRLSIAEAMAYMFRHVHVFVVPPLRIIVLAAVAAGVEIGLFYLCRWIPYLYGILFFPLLMLTLLLLVLGAVLVVFTTFSAPAAAVDAYTGPGAFEKVHHLLRRKPGAVLGYTLLIACITGLASCIIFSAGKRVFHVQQKYFAGNILVAPADENTGVVPRRRGYDYYDPAFAFLKKIPAPPSAGSVREPRGEPLDKLKGVLFLLSLYVTISVFFSYVLSLYSSLATVGYLALTEESGEV